MKLPILAIVAILLSVYAGRGSYSECPPRWTTPPPPCETCPCPPGSGGSGGGGGGRGGGSCGSCRLAVAGMPRWEIRESQVDYRLFDTPLDYKPAYGPAIALNLVYQTWRWTDFGYFPDNSANPLFGPQWHCLWSSDIAIYHPSQTHWNYLGGRVIYQFGPGSLISDNASPDASRFEV